MANDIFIQFNQATDEFLLLKSWLTVETAKLIAKYTPDGAMDRIADGCCVDVSYHQLITTRGSTSSCGGACGSTSLSRISHV
jgi:hypothetical protein